MKIYLVKVDTTWYNSETRTEILWAATNEETAKKDCERMQNEHNKLGLSSYKEIFYYEEVTLYNN